MEFLNFGSMCISGCRMESNQNANEQVEHVEMHEDQNGACGISAANYSANGKISGILFSKFSCMFLNPNIFFPI